ncbi:hypothetical protein BpHYR1_054518 [Brachionus plicatilis]|uniref:Uncharacterized protein n=1 Tax=Brachionus plicatilis TaxID=10195 RepID=A0A3M7S2A3_BRAPC|nr:hypothetical protein BpHYR1_054518 [Brachionus plicatilis]
MCQLMPNFLSHSLILSLTKRFSMKLYGRSKIILAAGFGTFNSSVLKNNISFCKNPQLNQRKMYTASIKNRKKIFK